MTTQQEKQLEQCRAVYELVERGAIDAAHAALYRRELRVLSASGLVERRADGAYLAIRARGDQRPVSEPPPGIEAPEVPRMPPLVTITARVSTAVVSALERLNAETRSDAIRVLLERAVDAGLADAPVGSAPRESSRSTMRPKTGTND